MIKKSLLNGLVLFMCLFVGVTLAKADTYKKVTNASTLKAGDKVVFVGHPASAYLIASSVIENNYLTKLTSITVSNSKITSLPDGTGVFTLGKSGSYWTISNSTGQLLRANAEKKLAWEGKGTTTWNISVSSGLTTISSTKNTYGRILYNASSPRFLNYTSDLNSSMLLIELYRFEEPITITDAKYATYCSTNALNFSTTGITVYKAKVDGDVVKLTAIEDGIVPANTGVILYKDVDASTTVYVPVTTTDATITDNELVGTTAKTAVGQTADGKTNYIMQKSGDDIVFSIAKSEGTVYMPANRAYLSTPSAAPSRLSVTFTDETAGIDDASRLMDNGKRIMDNIFNLNGQRIWGLKKGLYIKNGKKVLVP